MRGAALGVAAILGGVLVFLGLRGAPAMFAGAGELPAHAANFWQLAGPLAFGSLWVAVLALAFAALPAIGVALAATVYAPSPKFGRFLAAVLDLLAAVPSVVFGLWGLMVLAPIMTPVYAWLHAHLGWLPLFSGEPSVTGRTVLTAGLVVAVMILPIMAAMCRESFALTPPALMEAATALGATRWEMVRAAVLPGARSGIVAGGMLGLGRALGETMAVAMVLSATPFLISFNVISSENPATIAAFIASTFPESTGSQVSALIALGLILFAISLLASLLGRRIARRGGAA
ncbi:MAG: phosphate ABC transporter permease subunit PstC [Bifidobacteriaceae bacterium]|jgi:phosphate transport system permease protein|nr:phosphate ABC transporter permease subunit PstC [Bifidobacteriaceae bacterium]